ncbi:hypothetical protein CYMTET_48806, partial [Cymbomonas tetramitiformis]
GNERCPASARRLYDEEGAKLGWAECSLGQRYRLRMTAGAYAADVAVQLLRDSTVPGVFLPDPTFSTGNDALAGDLSNTALGNRSSYVVSATMFTSIALGHMDNLEEKVLDLCLAPGIYRVWYWDDPSGQYRPGGFLDRNAMNNWYGAKLTVANGSGCVTLDITRPEQNFESENDPALLTATFGAGEAFQAHAPQGESHRGVEHHQVDPTAGQCMQLDDVCPFADDLVMTFRTSASAVIRDKGPPGFLLYEQACANINCANRVIATYGVVDGQECCKASLGAMQIDVRIPHTGDEAHLPVKDEEPRLRYLGIKGANRLLAGLMLKQTRLTDAECNTRFDNLSSACHTASPLSEEMYGVDPVFLPTSELYDSQLGKYKCCNISTYTSARSPNARPVRGSLERPRQDLVPASLCQPGAGTRGAAWGNRPGKGEAGKEQGPAGLTYLLVRWHARSDCMPPACGDYYKGAEMRSEAAAGEASCRQGVDCTHRAPYGFFPYNGEFYVWFDINLSHGRAQDLIKYLIDGLYIDERTQTVHAQLITYNSQLRLFGNVNVYFQFSSIYGGVIHIQQSVQTINVEMYQTTTDLIRAVFEVFFLLMVLISILSELREMFTLRQKTGSIGAYFSSAWNYIDVFSILMCAFVAMSWIEFYNSLARSFNMEPRYLAYASLTSQGRWLKLNGDGEIFQEVLDRLTDMHRMTVFQVDYMTMNGICSFLLIMRILKLCDFQPRMGIITRTLAVAASDLYHFFLLLLIIFLGYAITGHLVFGTTIKGFSEMGTSIETLFNMMVFGDNSVVAELDAVSSSVGASMQFIAMLFYMSYAMLVVMVLLNFLLAIVVDAFAVVKESAQESTSIGAELLYYGQAYYDQKRNREMTDQQAVQYLKDLRSATEQEIRGKHESISVETAGETSVKHEDSSWEEMILVRGKDVESVSGAQVKQSLLEADALRRKQRRQIPRDQKISGSKLSAFGSEQTNEVTAFHQPSGATADEEVAVADGGPVYADLLARRVMQKFGLDECADDIDEEKMLQKQQTEQIIDSLKLLSVQMQEMVDQQRECMLKQQALEGKVEPLHMQLHHIEQKLGLTTKDEKSNFSSTD